MKLRHLFGGGAGAATATRFANESGKQRSPPVRPDAMNRTGRTCRCRRYKESATKTTAFSTGSISRAVRTSCRRRRVLQFDEEYRPPFYGHINLLNLTRAT